MQLKMRTLYIYSLLAVIPVIACPSYGHYQQQLLKNPQCDRPNIVFILTDDQDTHLNSATSGLEAPRERAYSDRESGRRKSRTVSQAMRSLTYPREPGRSKGKQ